MEQKGELELALKDLQMVILLYGTEMEILDEQSYPDRGSFIGEAAQAFRRRARLQEKLNRPALAAKDLKQAETYELQAWKLTAGRAKGAEGESVARLGAWKPAPVGRLLLVNQWSGPVTLRIDGTEYRLKPNEEKSVEKMPGNFRYELVESGQSASGNLEPGRTFRVRVGN